MTVRVVTGHIGGLDAVAIENDLLRITVLPRLGGRIWSIVHTPTGRDLLWHSSILAPAAVTLGAGYDAGFSGGWDEVFPSDARVEIDGIDYPDHGEIWSVPAALQVVESRSESATVHLATIGRVTGATFERWLTLRAGEAVLRVRYRITNPTASNLRILWKPHPALDLRGPARLDLPARRIVVDTDISTEIAQFEATWPMATGLFGPLDLRDIPPGDSGDVRFFNAVELGAGWCAVTHTDERFGFGLVFDPQVLPYVCVFGAFDDDHHINTIIVEPCTAYPYRLDQAIAQGTAGHIAPGDCIDTTILAVIYTGLDRVTSISPDGLVSG